MKPGPSTVLSAFAEEFQLDVQVLVRPPVPPNFAELPPGLHPRLTARLAELGLGELYSHQAEAVAGALEGKDTILSTGTSSGKTLAFLTPILNACYSEPNAKALILYPTKALAQDQLSSFQRIIGEEPVRIATYDADTPKSQRSSIRKSAHLLITNPDMLHIGILPSHELWVGFLKNLKYIVIDEMHTYTGVFGSHVAGVLRRLLRLCEWHGAKPTILAATATISDPQAHFEKLCGRVPKVIDQDGSPKAERTYAFALRRLDTELRPASPNQLAASLLARMTAAGFRSLAFSPSRNAAELVRKYAAEQLRLDEDARAEKIDSYRGGYGAAERREIEKRFREADLLGISSTNALELGIDIGGLDAVIMNGYPGSAASFWQQAGRTGRGLQPGLSVLLATDNPIDFVIAMEPQKYLFSGFDAAPVNLANPIILSQQLRCAAHERALSIEELESFGSKAKEIAEGLEQAGELYFSAGRYFYSAYEAPASKVSIRSAGGKSFTIRSKEGDLGTMEHWRVLQSGFPGAVYLHRGVTYVVTDLNFDEGVVMVQEREVAHYTVALGQSTSHELVDIETSKHGSFGIGLCSVEIHEQTTSYQKRSLDGSQAFETEELDLPPIDYQTLAVRFEAYSAEEDCIPSLHAFEHALLATAPLIAGCSPQDIGSSWFVELPGHEGPTLYVYDRTPGGIGLSEILYERVTEWINASTQLLERCSCNGGCPRCLLLARCPYNNEALSKMGALEWLRKAQNRAS